MFKTIESPYLVDFDNSFKIKDYSTSPPATKLDKKDFKKKLESCIKSLSELQRVLYASETLSVLVVFQAMDAGGKDSTIRTVMSGVNPAGCDVVSFKQPSQEELHHDFLWRSSVELPKLGKIVIFNRSYYEDVLITRVHPELLDGTKVPWLHDISTLWQERFESIADYEKHLARNGVVILKFWLNISKKEQKRRFLRRIDEPEKNWKFDKADIEERKHWDDYMQAYEEVISYTSKSWAPWYAIPADDKPFMRYSVARIISDKLKSLGLTYPNVDKREHKALMEMRKLLDSDS